MQELPNWLMSNYSPAAQASLIMPYGGEAKYFNESLVKQYGWEYNPQKAIEILEKELKLQKGKMAYTYYLMEQDLVHSR